MVADILALAAALALAVFLPADSGSSLQQIAVDFVRAHLKTLPIILALYLVMYTACQLYLRAWRFASIEMIGAVVSANTLGLIGFVGMQFALDHSILSWRTLFLLWLLSIVFVGGLRLSLRMAHRVLERLPRMRRRRKLPHTRVIILGAEADGARLVAVLRDEHLRNYEILGFLDDSPAKRGVIIRGVKVIGALGDLYKLLENNAVDEVHIAMPAAGGAAYREYVMACRRQQVPVKIIPVAHEVLGHKARLHLEDISVEDLLRRPPVSTDMSALGDVLSGKRVLVTGAGGSIGSELCRQIIACQPSKLILVGHGENSLHQIHQELRTRFPNLAERLHLVVGSVADEVRMVQVFGKYRPHVVFHAAAHKHVPIVEDNVAEAVQNNVMGTRWVAEACGRVGVERMVLVSTDKAVYPSSVMGATKWLCEEVVRWMAQRFPQTTYLTVRFGNVLGSRGSVVPIFQEQIKRGGPVTVTDSEMTRYFMTIPEAVQLVLQAGAIGRCGQLYLLDMGEPVRILDLARDTIRLCGYEPEVDIPITFTGLRPGEKLHERLTTHDEKIVPSPHRELLLVDRPQYFNADVITNLLRELAMLSDRGDTEGLIAILCTMVPHFAQYRAPGERPRAAEETDEIVTTQ